MTRPNLSFTPTSPGPTVKNPLPSHSMRAKIAVADASPRELTKNPVPLAILLRTQIHSSGTRVRYMLWTSNPASTTAPAVLMEAGTNSPAVPKLARGSSPQKR